jgi:dihydroorotase
MNELVIRLPDDFHVHARQGPAMAAYAARSAAHFGRFLAMPNVTPPLISAGSVADYAKALGMAVKASGYASLPLYSFKLVPGMGRDAVLACAEAGAIVGKYYPAGATTNSSDGVPDPSAVREELEAMQSCNLVLSIHGEDPSRPVFEREEAFLPVADRIIASYPRLRVVLEHVSSGASVEAVLRWPDRVAATMTPHHLSYTIDDVIGDRLDPVYYCKPILKSAHDRDALVRAATSGSPRFFFGSDSAPHPPAAKASGASGSYSSPVALSLLAAVFEDAGTLGRLEAFVSEHGARFYGLGLNEGRLRLRKHAWTVPAELDGVTPLSAGRTLAWTAERV